MNVPPPPGIVHPPRRNKRPTLVLVAAVTVPTLAIALAFGYALLRYNNIAFVNGPSRSQVTKTANDLVTKTLTSIDSPMTLGRTDAVFSPCGHGDDGFGPINYVGGIDVFISGVSPADHKKIEEHIDNQGQALAYKLNGDWGISVIWDSPTSTTGMINASRGCAEIAD